jgi:hypothetical protein
LNSIYEGDLAVITVSYFGQDLITPADPSIAVLKYKVGSGVDTVLTYTGIGVPAPGVYAKTATGVYVAWIDTTGKPGIWTAQGSAPVGSTIQATSRPIQFSVDPAI